jgi:hypothetical protein
MTKKTPPERPGGKWFDATTMFYGFLRPTYFNILNCPKITRIFWQIAGRSQTPLAQIFHTSLETESHCRGRREESFRKYTNKHRTPHVVPYRACEISGLGVACL